MLVFTRVLSLALDYALALCHLWTLSPIIGSLSTTRLLMTSRFLLSLLSSRSTFPISYQMPHCRPTPNTQGDPWPVSLFFPPPVYPTLWGASQIHVCEHSSPNFQAPPTVLPKSHIFVHSLGLGVLHHGSMVNHQDDLGKMLIYGLKVDSGHLGENWGILGMSNKVGLKGGAWVPGSHVPLAPQRKVWLQEFQSVDHLKCGVQGKAPDFPSLKILTAPTVS